MIDLAVVLEPLGVEAVLRDRWAGFMVTDPAAVIAQQQPGWALNQEQADALRRRVAEVRASLQRWADRWGMDRPAVARIRLAEIEARRVAALRNRPVSRVSAASAFEITRVWHGQEVPA